MVELRKVYVKVQMRRNNPKIRANSISIKTTWSFYSQLCQTSCKKMLFLFVYDFFVSISVVFHLFRALCGQNNASFINDLCPNPEETQYYKNF